MVYDSNSTLKQALQLSAFQLFWLCFAALTLVIRLIAPSSLIESVYSTTMFPLIRKAFDALQFMVPVHWLWLFFLVLALYLGYKIFRAIRLDQPTGYKLVKGMKETVVLLSVILVGFLWCWGFNYGRNGLYEQIGLKGKALDKEAVLEMVQDQMALLETLRTKFSDFPTDSTQNNYRMPFPEFNKIPDLLIEELSAIRFPVAGSPKYKLIRPKGILLRLNTAGFYMPWTGEANIDAGLHPLQMPFVIAHELGHAHGVTDEGACNFLAVLVGRRMQGKMRYAFELTYFRYLMGKLNSLDHDLFVTVKTKYPPLVKLDLVNIRKNSDQYPEFFTGIRNLFYDTYLKSQGVKAGMDSYRQVVNMVAAWDEKRPD